MWKETVVFLLLAMGFAVFYNNFNSDLQVPELPETYWGSGEASKDSNEIKPFKINVPKEVIEDLHARLDNARPLVPPLQEAGWTYGVSSDYLQNVIKYWRNKYNWSERQALLNKYPQFTTKIQGLNIHFYHVKPTLTNKSPKVRVLPLLLLHGWPGSVVEFQKIIPLLTTPRKNSDFVFEVVIPSLPGYGFSEATSRQGLGVAQMSVIFKNLMKRVGFDKFYAQGGDWGSLIVDRLALLFPDNVLGGHVNGCLVNNPSSHFWTIVGAFIPQLVVDAEHKHMMYPLKEHYARLLEEMGYLHLQATKPDTIGIALTQSPVAHAAYILEKFSTWTNPDYRFRDDGGLLEKFSIDELIDNLMIYWVTNTITTSQRIYSEVFNKAQFGLELDKHTVSTPMGCAAFPHELMYQPESLVKSRFLNLLQFTYMPRGGHFSSFEEPELVANDVWSFVKKAEHFILQEAQRAKAEKQKQKS